MFLISVESVDSTEDLATTFGSNIGNNILAAVIVATEVLAFIVTGLQVKFLSSILTLLEYWCRKLYPGTVTTAFRYALDGVSVITFTLFSCPFTFEKPWTCTVWKGGISRDFIVLTVPVILSKINPSTLTDLRTAILLAQGGNSIWLAFSFQGTNHIFRD